MLCLRCLGLCRVCVVSCCVALYGVVFRCLVPLFWLMLVCVGLVCVGLFCFVVCGVVLCGVALRRGVLCCVVLCWCGVV